MKFAVPKIPGFDVASSRSLLCRTRAASVRDDDDDDDDDVVATSNANRKGSITTSGAIEKRNAIPRSLKSLPVQRNCTRSVTMLS